MKRVYHSVKNAFMVHTINMLTVLCNSVAVFSRHVNGTYSYMNFVNECLLLWNTDSALTGDSEQSETHLRQMWCIFKCNDLGVVCSCQSDLYSEVVSCGWLFHTCARVKNVEAAHRQLSYFSTTNELSDLLLKMSSSYRQELLLKIIFISCVCVSIWWTLEREY